MLKALMLRKKLDEVNKLLTEARSVDFQTREAELANDIEEAKTDEEKKAVEEAVAQFESEKEANEKTISELEERISELEKELAECETEKPAARTAEKKIETRENKTMSKFFGMTIEQRDAFLAREDVKEFIARFKELKAEKRAVKGGEVLIPTVVLDLIRENVTEYSKLIKHIRLRQVSGHARQNVATELPEAVWTEMCAAFNEMDLNFAGVEVDGYKVGGYIAVCNSLLKDSEVALAQEIIIEIAKAIGKALDKAIIYGTGSKMPLGIATRLFETSDPSRTNTTIPWTDLHTTHVLTYNHTGKELIEDLLTADGVLNEKYSGAGDKFWACNRKTYNKILAAALAVNGNGAYVSQVNYELPVVGGRVEILDFVQDNVLIGGYGNCYILAEREGFAVRSSDQPLFLKDQTAFVGEGRYDGAPVIADAFVAIGISNTAPSASGITFAGDDANDARLLSLALGSVTLGATFDPATLSYTGTASGASGAITLVPAQASAIIDITYNDKHWVNGQTITYATGTKNLVVTVRQGNKTLAYTVAITKS